MQYRWDIRQFTYSLQTCSAEFFCFFVHQTCFCSSLCRTSRSNDNDIVCDHFLHQLDMGCIRSYFRVVTSNHGNCTADNTGCDTLQKRFCCSHLINLRVCNAIQSFYDCFYRISNGCFLFHIWNMYQFRFSVLEVFDCHLYDCFCIFSCCLSVETDKFRIRHLCDRRSCYEFCMETFAQRSKCREDTLNVYNDCFTCTGQYYVFLLQEVTCHRNTTTHCNFV